MVFPVLLVEFCRGFVVTFDDLIVFINGFRHIWVV